MSDQDSFVNSSGQPFEAEQGDFNPTVGVFGDVVQEQTAFVPLDDEVQIFTAILEEEEELLATAPPDSEPSPIEGSIDGFNAGRLYIWCMNTELPDSPVTVDLLVNGRLFGRYLANEHRPDLEAAGKGSGQHGLTVDLDGSHLLTSGESLSFAAYAASWPKAPFATFEVQPSFREDVAFSPQMLGHLRQHLTRQANAIYGQSLTGWGASAPVSIEGSDMTPIVADAAIETSGLRKVTVSKYANFTRQRMRVEEQFKLGQASVETDNFLKWYLESESARRAGRRTPLSAGEIAYLNELVVFGGQQYQISRVTWMFLLDDPGLLQHLNLNAAESYLNIVYWWSIERSRSLWVEDCLVHHSYRQTLSSVTERWRVTSYPLSRFMELYFNRRVEWHFLHLDYEHDRAIYYALLLLAALQQPTILQYIPRVWLTKMAAPREQGSLLSRILEQVMQDSPVRRYLADYDHALRECGFDLGRNRSMSLTVDGHRIANVGLRPEAAMLEPVSVQVIGPLQKASGLGQATRLSFDAVSRRFADCSGFDFDLDNPAPVGFNAERTSSPLRRAKINLIHLNAESIPLAYAFLPDVFTGAYNIGYFFWELDSPASCHGLALDLLDEVWVAAEYGVEQYRPFTDIPITKVGMSYDDVAVPSRSVARGFLISRLGLAPDSFVFLAAFDSFSFIQRKNPQAVVRAFLDAFPGEPRVRLVLKTHNRDFVTDPVQQKIWQLLDEAVAMDPRIMILNETLVYDQLLLLKAGCDCYVSLHRSEGWGFGMLEAMHIGIPVLATDYSGNTEFCTPETAWTVGYSLIAMGPGDYIFVKPGQTWAEPNHPDAVRQMRDVFLDVKGREERVARAKAFVDQRFSPEAVAQRYADRLHAIATAPGRSR